MNLESSCWLVQKHRSFAYCLCCAACLPCLLRGSGPARQGPRKRPADRDLQTVRIDPERLLRHSLTHDLVPAYKTERLGAVAVLQKVRPFDRASPGNKQTDSGPNPVPPVIYTVFPPGKPLEWSPDFAPFEMKHLFEDRERLFALQRKLDQRESVSERPPFGSHHELITFPSG